MSSETSSEHPLPTIHVSMAAFPGLRHEQAVQLAMDAAAHGRLSDPWFGPLSTRHIQLVPQNHGVLTPTLCVQLMATYPEVRFRLHANVRVQASLDRADLATFERYPRWFAQAAKLHRMLGASSYTAHAGLRKHASMSGMLDNARRCADLFGSPVGVEGLYPTAGDAYLVSTWSEYRQLMDSGVPYAIDLSHLNILATQSRQRDDGLVQDFLACERCLEVHISANDGRGDWHQCCQIRDGEPWWAPMLRHVHAQALVFCEGNLRESRREGSSHRVSPASGFGLESSMKGNSHHECIH